MIKIFVLLFFLTFISCQELVVRNWKGNYNDGEQTSKTYQKSEWNNLLDVAVYGWFKINSALSRSNYSILFHLTSNDATFIDNNSYGDRVLLISLQSNSFYTRTNSYQVSLDPGPGHTISFTTSDLNLWSFFYISFGSASKKVFTYYKFPNSGEKTGVSSNVVHLTSNFYRIYVGQSYIYKYFQGSLYNIFLKFGSDAYKENNFQSLTQINPNDPVPSFPSNIISKLIITHNTDGADIVFDYQC